MNGLPTSSRSVAKLKKVSARRKKPPDTFCRQLKRKAPSERIPIGIFGERLVAVTTKCRCQIIQCPDWGIVASIHALG
jgi:hypothetical protein